MLLDAGALCCGAPGTPFHEDNTVKCHLFAPFRFFWFPEASHGSNNRCTWMLPRPPGLLRPKASQYRVVQVAPHAGRYNIYKSSNMLGDLPTRCVTCWEISQLVTPHAGRSPNWLRNMLGDLPTGCATCWEISQRVSPNTNLHDQRPHRFTSII